MDPPESLEKIFQRVEEESERRAQEEKGLETPQLGDRLKALSPTPSSSSLRTRSRRRGSVSISRFGQLDELTRKPSSDNISIPPKSPTIISTLAAQSTFYKHHGENGSYDSVNSVEEEDERAHAEDAHQVTQVHRIAPRQSISRTVGSLIPRRLSRASRQVIAETNAAGDVVIGVSVEAATVEAEGGAGEAVQATVHAPGLRPKASKASLVSLGSGSGGGWLHKAKSFTGKFRRKSKPVLTTDSVT
ncbi:hypothetical protein D9758_006291 [Tetrapyrgos nigripes]|uniref:Uncharacterized protein n=1 Tax=Tetrapyrgos nigripes TaxID=182062 RepID=A0A8H5FZZ4_9AGAR|nr:hypothetical protein D9758_006291 [Tetrapyrgos nigripes]